MQTSANAPAPIVQGATCPIDSLDSLASEAAALAADAYSPATRRGYASALRAWERFQSRAENPNPPAWVLAMQREGLAIATISHRVAALAWAHRAKPSAYPNPYADDRVGWLLRGARRRQRENPRGRGAKHPITPEIIAAGLHALTVRDQALVLVGLATGCRAAELASMRWEHASESRAGLVIRLGSRKSGPAGQCVGVPRGRGRTCPVAALAALRAQQGSPSTGEIFGCCERTIARACKALARVAGMDPRHYSAHSLRAGMITAASEAGASLGSIMAQSGHASATVAASYVRHVEAARNPAARAVVSELVRADLESEGQP